MNADATSLSWWITQLGPSGIALFILWRVLVFMRPHVEALVPWAIEIAKGHCQLMRTMDEHIGNGAITLKKVSDTQDGHGVLIQEIHDRVVR